MTDNSKNPATASDSARRPTVAPAPSGPAAAASAFVAAQLFHRAVSRLPLRVVYPDGTQRGGGDAGAPVLVVRHPDRLHRRLGVHGLVGFGESFMAAEWESTDLVAVLTALAPTLTRWAPWGLRWPRPRSPQLSRAQTQRNVAAHYDDLSSDLFIEFLDETMTYSSAWFDRLPATWSDLADAQRRKIDRVLDAAGVGPGTRLLEIGTGWGELPIRAAARGAEVRSITPSEQQQWLARQRIAAAGKSDRVRVDVCDYHDIAGRYDAVISVEMVEAVGHRSWPGFVRALERAVTPGGRVVLQSIAMPHTQMLATRNRQTWTRTYIFPGGQIPSAKALLAIAERKTTLRPVDMLSLGEHYAETLRMWRERFLQRRKTLGHIGFDEVFARMWELYLASREAGFRSGNLNVYQWTFVNKASP
ncbi:class I SAM-dependent methyltransferase [Mycobacterium cookii]|uniref:class I SAM-dependent methyltransferase n=1 Tax=Mycobacterium cookii TaxID=1775 RepID=UPI0013D813F5|nr:class I SAM-dependent methyltransferase [Mycobacterium cookii]MCV7329732.1 class I SAM-dependent methyltransferase [Mycobacterium cookii]